MSDPVTRQEQLLSAIATGGDIISPITREEMYLAYLAGDTSVVLPEPITRKEQFLYQACLNGGGGGGTEITDGIVVKARDSQHRPTAIEYFGEYISAQSLGSPNGSVGFGAGLVSAHFHSTVYVANGAFYKDANLTSITGLFENIEYIGADAFNGCTALEIEIALPAGVTYGASPFINSGIKKFSTLSPSAITRSFCYNCNKLVQFSAANVSTIEQNAFGNCTALAEVTLGSIGHAITTLNNAAFSGDTQTGLTVTGYTTSAYADTALTNIRNGATNATIIIKDSTTGETIVTSTP